MKVSKETRTVQLTAPDLAQIASLPEPEKWHFSDGEADATAVLERDE